MVIMSFPPGLNGRYGKCPKISNTKVADKLAYANMNDSDQTAPEDQSEQSLHCLPFY